MALASCKTTEANYKAAYEAAKASRSTDASADIDDDTQRLLAAKKREAQSKEIVNGDTIAVTTLFIGMEPGYGLARVPQYSLVLNAFTQKFNAQAMVKRLIEAGFTDAYVFHTSVPDYYVAAGGFDEIDGIPALLRRVEQAGNLGQRAGFPAVIRNGGWRPN